MKKLIVPKNKKSKQDWSANKNQQKEAQMVKKRRKIRVKCLPGKRNQSFDCSNPHEGD